MAQRNFYAAFEQQKKIIEEKTRGCSQFFNRLEGLGFYRFHLFIWVAIGNTMLRLMSLGINFPDQENCDYKGGAVKATRSKNLLQRAKLNCIQNSLHLECPQKLPNSEGLGLPGPTDT